MIAAVSTSSPRKACAPPERETLGRGAFGAAKALRSLRRDIPSYPVHLVMLLPGAWKETNRPSALFLTLRVR